MTTACKPAVLLATGSLNCDPWANAIRAAEPERRLLVWPDVQDPEAVGYLLAWGQPHGILATLPNLKAIFSLGAGIDHLVSPAGLPDVPIIRVVDPDLTQRMSEWVVLQVLIHHRQQLSYNRQQAARIWKELAQPAAADLRVGIMGLGVLGRDAAGVLHRLGFQVAGWSRQAKSIPNVRCFHGAGDLDRFLARTDILVCLLPQTPDTKGILSMPLFKKLAGDGPLGGAILINAGRGGLQIETDIIAALDRGILVGASLDVFESEPLDQDNPLWTRPEIVITPHAAAATMPDVIVPSILRQIAAFEAGASFANLVDRNQLY